METTGILLLHGFAGTRDEIKPLYQYLINKGYQVKMPILPGHEGGKISKVTYYDWISCAEAEFALLKEISSKVAVIGFSMGGLIAVQLYQKYPFDNLITINTPIYYWNIKMIIKNIIKDYKFYSKKYLLSGRKTPLPALLQFQRLLTNTKGLFKSLTCKTLIIQTLDDDTVNPKSAKYIYKRIRGEKAIKKLPKGGHVIFQTNDYMPLLKEVESFLSI